MGVRANGELSDNIPVMKGIRQRDYLSPTLFNVVLEEIINEVNHMRGYRMGRSVFNIICYADDIILIHS